MIWKKSGLSILLILLLSIAWGQQIQVQNFSTATYGSGAGISVPVRLTGCFAIGNQFQMYLSDENGNFAPGTLIGSYNAFFTPFVNGVIPAGTTPGSNYKIRIVSTSPAASVETGSFSISSTPVAPVINPQASPANTINDSTYGRCLIFSNQMLTLLQNVPAGHTLSAQVVDSIGNTIPSTVTATQVQFTMVTGNYYTVTIRLENTVDQSQSVKSFLVYVSNNNLSLQTSGASDACLPDTKIYTVNVYGNGGIRTNYPGTVYSINWGDGTTDTYTHCEMIANDGEMRHDYVNTSCGQPPITDLSPVQYNAFRVNVQATNVFCPSSFTSITTYAKVWQKPIAEFINPEFWCINVPVTFMNTSEAGLSGYNNVVNCIDVAQYEWYVDGVFQFNAPRDLTYTFTTPGYHTIRLVALNDPCSDEIEKVICIEEPLQPEFKINGADSLSGCAPFQITIQNNTIVGPNPCRPLPWQWDVVLRPSMTLAQRGVHYTIAPHDSATNPTFNFLVPGEYFIRLSVPNSCGTLYRDVPVTITDIADVNFTAGSSRYCGVQTIDFSQPPHRPNYNYSTGSVSYNWIITGGSYSFVGGTSATHPYPQVQFHDLGAYTVEIQFSNDCGMQTASRVFRFDAPVTATAGNDTTVCNTATTIPLFSSASGAVNSTQWIVINGSGSFSDASAADPVYTLSATDKSSGTVRLGFVAAGAAGSACGNDTAEVVITILQQNIITSSSDTTICTGGAVDYTPVASIGGSTFSWTSTIISGTVTGNTPIGNGAIIDSLVNTSASDVAVVRYFITPSGMGCDGVVFEYNVTVLPSPTLQIIEGADTLCTGGTTNITIASSYSNSLFSYSASLVSGNATGFSSQAVPGNYSNINHTLSNTGTAPAVVQYIIQLHTSNLICGGEMDTVLIVVHPSATVANAGTDQLLCNATTAILQGNQPTVGNGVWSQIEGPAVVFADSADHQTALSGLLPNETYRFVWTISGNAVCPSTTDTVTIVNRPAVTPAQAGDDIVYCTFNGSTVAVTLTANNPAHTFETGAWAVVAPIPAGGNPTIASPNVHTSAFSFSQPGTYYLVWTINNDAGCDPSIDTVEVIVFPAPFAGAVTPPVSNICYGGNVNLAVAPVTGTVMKWQYNPAPFGDEQWLDTLVTNTAIAFENITDSMQVRAIVQSPGWSMGCTETDTSDIAVIHVSPLSVGGNTVTDAVVCTGVNGGTILLSGYTGNIIRWERTNNGGTSWNNIANSTDSLVYANLSSTTWYRAVVQSGNCSPVFSDTTIITVVPAVQQANAGADQLICSTVTNLQGNTPAAGETGAWSQASGPNIASFIASAPTTNITGMEAGTYHFVWTLSNGICDPTMDTVMVVVRPEVTIANAGGPLVVCDLVNDTTIAIQANTDPSRPYESGLWTIHSQPVNGNGVIANPAQAVTTFTLHQPGTYQLVWTISNDAGCTPSADTLAIHVVEMPVAGVVAGTTGICAGAGATVHVTNWKGNIKKWQYNPAPFNDNIWFDSLVTASSLQFVNVHDSFAVRVIVQSAGGALGCFSEDTSNVHIVHVSPATVPGNTGADATICAGNNNGSIILTGHVGEVVRWESSNNNGITWTSISHTASSLSYTNLTATTWYRAWVQSGNCALMVSDTTVITVVPQVQQAQAGNDQLICDTTTNLQANAPATGENGTWTQIAGPTAAVFSSHTDPNANVSQLAAGSYRFVWTLSNTACEPTHDTLVVQVRPAVTMAQAGNDVVICEFLASHAITLAGNSIAARPFETGTWTILQQPTGATATLSDPSHHAAEFTFNRAGTYTLLWTITNDAGCTPAADTMIIHAFDKPGAGTVSGPADICAGADITIAMTAYTGNIKKWQYNPAPINDNIWIDTVFTAASIQFNGVMDSFAIRAIVQSTGVAYGCTIEDTSNVHVVNVAPGSVPGTTGPDAIVCNGINGGTLTLTGNVGNVVRWVSSTNNGATWQSITNTTNTFTYSNLTTTTWYRAVIESANCGQVFSSTTVITVMPQVNAANAGPDQLTCNNNTYLSANPASAVETGSWLQAGGPSTATFSSVTAANAQVSDLQAGTYYFVWTLTNGGCPPSADTVVIRVRPAVTPAVAGNDTTICDFTGNGTITLQGNATRTFENGNWTIISQPAGGNASFSDVADPGSVFNFQSAGVYTLQYAITNDAGCTPSNDTVVIHVFERPAAGPLQGPALVCAGSDVTVSLSSFTGVIQKWQYNPAPVNDNVWMDTLVSNPAVSFNNLQDTIAVRVIVQSAGYNSGCMLTDTSNVLVVQVTPATLPGTTAANDTLCIGSNGGLITLNNAVGSVNRWEYSTNSGNSWNAIANTTHTLQYHNLVTTTWYRAIIESGNCGEMPSSITIITVMDSISVPDAGADQVLCNQTQTVLQGNHLRLDESGRWQQIAGPAVTLSSIDQPTITVSGMVPGVYRFIYTISNAVCPSLHDTVTVTNYPPVVNMIDTTTRTICTGQPVTVSGQQPTGGNGEYQYQWQQSTNASSWVNIAGETNSSLTFQPNGNVYVRRIVYSQPCETISLVAHILVLPPVANNTIAPHQNICVNTAAAPITGSLPAGATGTYIYQWQESTDGGASWLNIPGATDRNYQPGILNVTTLYRRVVSSGVCSASQGNVSDSVVITVNPDAVAHFTFAKDTSCPVFVLDSSVIQNQHFAGNGGYMWFANGSLLGTSSYFPGYDLTNSGDSVLIKLIAISATGCNNDTMEHMFYAKMKPSPAFVVDDSVGCGPLTVNFTNLTPDAAFYQFRWNFGNGQVSNAFNPGSVVFMPNTSRADTVYNISLTVYSECDSIVLWQSIRVKAQPRSVFNPDKTFGCSPLTVNFQNLSFGSNNFTWDFDDGTVINTNSTNAVQHTFVTTVRDTFVVKLIARNDCGADTSRFSVIVSPNDIQMFVTVNGTELSGCAPHTVRFYNRSVGATNYLWNFGDGNTITTNRSIDTVTHVFNQPGDYTIAIRGSNSCSDTVTYQTITVHGSPAVAFTATPMEVCIGENVNFANLSDTITGSAWQFGDGNVSSLTHPVHAYTAPGDYTVTLVGTRLYSTGNTCAGTATQVVRVIDSRPGDFTMSDSISRCVPFTVTFTNLVQPSALTTWQFGDGSRDTGNVVTHTFTSVGEFAVQMRAVAPGGCIYTANKKVTVTGPEGSINYEHGLICGSRPLRFEAISSGTDSVRWYFGDGNSMTTTANVIFYTYNRPGTFIPRAELITGNGSCRKMLPGTDTIRVEHISAGFTSAMVKECGATRVMFTDTSRAHFGVQQWAWSFGDGGTSTVKNPEHTYTASSNWQVRLIATSAAGCRDTTTRIIDVPLNTFPVVSIISDTTVCANNGINLQSAVVSQDSISMYLWSFSNGTNSSSRNASTSFGSAGQQTATLVVSTINGCRDTATRRIMVNPSPIVNATGGRSMCNGEPVQLNASGALTYTWTNGATLSCTNCPNPIALTPVSATYEVTGTNSFGCIGRDTVSVIINQPFKIRASNNDTICIGETLELFATGAQYYRWTPAASLSRHDIQNPIATPVVNTTYRVVGYDSANCFTDTAFVQVSVGKLPTVSLGPDKVVAAGTMYPMATSVTNGPIIRWEWTSGQNVTCTNCPMPVAHIKNDVSYSVRVTNTMGCQASDTISFKVFCEQSQVYIPNVFTPDDDGVNDVLMVRGKGIKTIKSFRIFNRWGEIVFEKSNFEPNMKSHGWDGRVRGQKAPPDVYVYTCEVMCENDVPYTYKGNVAIIK